MNCSGLTSFEISNSITSIGSYAFSGCSALKSVLIHNPNCTIYTDKNTLGVPGTTKIYAEAGSTAETYANTYNFEFEAIAHVHNYVCEIAKVPTIEESGLLACTCNLCNDIITITLPTLNKIDYQYEIIEDATASSEGLARYTWRDTRYGTFSFEAAIPVLPSLAVSSAIGTAGSSVTVELSLANNPGIVSAYLDLIYDTDRLTLTDIEDTGLLAGALFSNDLFTVPFALNWDDSLASKNNTANGVIAKLTFQIKEDCPEGIIPITVSFNEGNIIDKDLNNVDFLTVDGAVEVVNYILGDVDGDGRVLAKDVATLRRYLAHWTGVTIVEAAADVNKDGNVTAADVAILRRYLAHWTGVTLSAAPVPQTAARRIPHRGANDPTISISSIEGEVGEQVTLTVDLLNNPGIVSAYLDLSYDNTKLKLISVEDTKLLNGALFSNDYSIIPFALNWDDSIASANNTKSGTIAKLTFEILNGCKDGPATVSISYADGNILNYDLDSVDFALETGTVSVHVHQYTAVVTEPTCTAQGYTTYTCACGDGYIDDYVPALGHDYELTGWNWTGYTAATATFTCANDASHVQAANAAITSARTEPTCEADGKVVYTAKVTFEGKDYTDTKTETLNVLGHNWNAPTYTWSADNSKVTASRTCKNDASHVETETVNTTGEVTKPATCTEKGETTYTATFTNTAFAKQTKTVADVNATGHTAGEAVDENRIAPTCTEPGGYDTVVYCTICSAELNRTHTELAALGHTAGTPVKENEVAATCEAAGSYDEVTCCSICGAELSREAKTAGNALGHDWSEPTYSWSADYSEVTAKRTCKRDESHAETETVTTTSEVTKPATTDEKGETTYTAVFANPVFSTQTKTVANIDMIGLEWAEPTYIWSADYSTVTASRVCTNKAGLIETEIVNTTSEVTKPASCTEKGETTYTAEFENAAFAKQTKVVENIEALGHDYQAVVTAPTCTEKGYTTYTCSSCGDSYVADETSALGHTPAESVKENEAAASCESAGGYDMVIYCSICNAELSCEHTELPATGHDWNAPTYTWSENNSTVTASRVCKNDASHIENEIAATTSKVTKEATYGEEGEITYTATFENPAFATQTKKVATPKLDEPKPYEPCDGGDSCPGNIFTDMPAKGNWAHDAIDWAIVNKITSGTSATTFSPNAGCTRAQVVTFLWRAAGSPEPTSTSNPFTDVKESAYYYKAVLWAVEKGITMGTAADKFSPDATCTRAQIVTFLWRYEGTPAPKTNNNLFTDVKAGAYYEKAVLWAAETGVTAGTSVTTFSPDDTCTRAQVVTFLYRDILK